MSSKSGRSCVERGSAYGGMRVQNTVSLFLDRALAILLLHPE